MTSPLETLVTEDLRDLAAKAGHPRASEPASGGAFRDPRGHALAQRARLLLQHADELGAEVRRSAPIYASRVARIVTALGLLVYGIGLFAAYPPEPGSRWVPEPLLNHGMAFFALLFVYGLAHRLAARGFRRRLAPSALLPPEGALPEDAPRIREQARRLVDQLDGRSVGATIAACCAFAPMLAYTCPSASAGAARADARGPRHEDAADLEGGQGSLEDLKARRGCLEKAIRVATR